PPPPPGPAPAAAAPKENLGKLLTETDVYVKYGLHDKALDHLRKVFAVDPENIDAHEKAFHIYVASNNQAQAAEQLLNVLRLHTRRSLVERSQPFLTQMLAQNPGHPEVPAFLAVLRPDGQQSEDAISAEEAILVDTSDEELVVAEAPEDALAGDMGLRGVDEGAVNPDMVADEALAIDGESSTPGYDLGPPPISEPEAVVGDEPLAEDPAADEPLLSAAAASVDDEVVSEVHTGEFDTITPDDPVTQTAGVPGIDDLDTREVPTDMGAARLALGEAPVEVTDRNLAMSDPPPEDEVQVVAGAEEELVEAPAEEAYEAPAEEAVEAPAEEDPAGEELEEASFFIEQGLWDEAREILETVTIAYPGHVRAQEMLAKVEAGSASANATGEQPTEATTAPTEAPPLVAPNGESEGKDAFDLAAELASELGETEGAAEPAPAAADEDFQYSVEEVFSEFKKGLEKVVKPGDVDTHYDLGIAYKEMGLLDDAVGEFTVARQGCVGQKKEVDCLAMSGALHLMRGDPASAVEAYEAALQSPHATGDVEKAIRYELAAALEQAQELGKALAHFLKVEQLDPAYRDVKASVARLSAVTEPDPGLLPKASAPGRGPGARKVGYL
ncbi:MAG: hypothetical protein K1X89_11325, partial [Myxococcaceae bacterium]|nr:hypothetical protein [Myxococcaceae bacterium]